MLLGVRACAVVPVRPLQRQSDTDGHGAGVKELSRVLGVDSLLAIISISRIGPRSSRANDGPREDAETASRTSLRCSALGATIMLAPAAALTLALSRAALTLTLSR